MIYNSELRKSKAKKKCFDNLNISIWIGQWFISRVTLKAKICSEGSYTYVLQVTVELLKIENYL